MSNNYIKLFPDLLEAWAALTDEEVGRLVRGLAFYQRTGQLPALDGNERIMFPACRAQIDRDNQSYERQREANAENGKKGGRPKSEQNRKNPMGFSESEKSQDKEKDKDKDKDDPPLKPPRGTAFDRFWQSYPKKVGKQAARKAFQRVKAPLETLLTAIERQKCSDQWSRDNGQYIPNPATWLNQGRWEDELPLSSVQTGSSSAPSRRYHLEVINGEEVLVYDD